MFAKPFIKTALSILQILFVAALCKVFQACDEEPVVITQKADEFDSARFNWKSMDIYYHGFAGIWATDTNSIYLLNHYNRSLYNVNGSNTVIQNVGDYYLSEIKGISNNELYLFGTSFTGNLTIIKYDGAGFGYIPTNISVSGDAKYFVRGCAISSNEIWILSQNGTCKYDGDSVTSYSYENPSLTPKGIFLSDNNEIQYISGRTIDTSNFQEVLYEFRDTGFVKIFDHIIQPYPNRTGVFLHEIRGFKFGIELNEPLGQPYTICIKYFTGSSFFDYFCFSNKIYTWVSQSPNPVGTNLQNFIYLVSSSNAGPLFGHYHVGVVHWNGERVSREFGIRSYFEPYPYSNSILSCANQFTYFVLAQISENEGNSTLYIGTKKKQ